jgi:hypothetical protein
MSKNVILVLLYHRHKLLGLNYGFYLKETHVLGFSPKFSQGLHIFISNDHISVESGIFLTL